MPNIKSAKKRVLVANAKTLRNRMIKSSLRTAIRRFFEACNQGDKDKAAVEMTAAVKKIDKAAAKGVIHKNNAANKKSRIALAYNSLAKS
jgi:small subunit ribosomal protein S20